MEEAFQREDGRPKGRATQADPIEWPWVHPGQNIKHSAVQACTSVSLFFK